MNEPDIFTASCQIDEIVCIAPGPSLTQAQVDMVMEAGKFTIAIGDAWRYAPYADILYHCDKAWWKYYNGVPEFLGDLKLSLEPTFLPGIKRVLKSAQRTGYSSAPYVVTGKNSGYQAINLALHFKPKKVLLIGYDMKDSKDGRHNIIGDHPKEIKRGFNTEQKVNAFTSLADALEKTEVSVYNCTLDTALNCFEKRELIDVL